MLDARGLECVRGRRQVFQDVSFSLGAGECFELRGPNGSGKTSLLRMLCGLLSPTSGSILWRGEPISSLRETYHRFVTYVGHRPAVKDELTALENLRVSSALSGFVLSRDKAREVLERMSLADLENVHVRYLSEGQRRRLALARLLAGHTPLWLLDEVLTSLDEVATRSVMTLIDQHLEGGGAAVIATHHELELRIVRPRRIELAA
jgi:heme exporter protein A